MKAIIKINPLCFGTKRNRCGFVFTKNPQIFELTEDEMSIIAKDRELVFCDKDIDLAMATEGKKTYETNEVINKAIETSQNTFVELEKPFIKEKTVRKKRNVK